MLCVVCRGSANVRPGVHARRVHARRGLALTVAVLSVIATLGCPRDTSDGPGSIVLVILDTVRADHLSCYGYERPTTPELDRLASEGVRFDQAWSQSSWTLPAVTTILTGHPPHVHGAGRGAERFYTLRDEVPTLAERLAENGYRTAAFINVVWCDPESGLARGFETYDHRTSDATNLGQRTAGETTDAALRWASSLSDEPFFLVVHYFDPHLTYDAPEPYDSMFETGTAEPIARGFGSAGDVHQIRRGVLPLGPGQRTSLVARYDGELRYTDDQFGRLRNGLEALGLWNDSLVVVVADHGEEFWDHHGFEHGHSHYRELLRVPLIVRRPGGTQGVVNDDRVRQLDIAPTLLEFAGLPVPDALPGRPLGRSSAEFSLAEGTLWGGQLASVRSDGGTLIWDRARDRHAFFGPDDPGEKRPLPPARAPADLIELLRMLPSVRAGEDAPWVLTEEQLERLRALGYVK